ncbi:MAG: hypothetical protein SFV22_05300 [Saprospiraceae bacterium]|nr:hypothetical protein [Saprospiraceae bacterium]
MNHVLKIVIWVFLSILLIFLGCGKEPHCGGYSVADSYFSFKLVDRTGANLIAKWGAYYLSDSVFLVKKDGSLPNDLEIVENGRITFYIPDSEQEAVDSIVTKEYLLLLPDISGNPSQDVDTLMFKYRFDNGGCYLNFQAFFNDSLYHNGPFNPTISFVKF